MYSPDCLMPHPVLVKCLSGELLAALVACGLHEHLRSVNTKGILDIVFTTVLFLSLGSVKVFTVKSNPEESLGRE